MYNIRTFNQIAERGLQMFPVGRYSVGPNVGSPDALLIRSHKLAPDALNAELRAVARAGAGVNNVPVDACTDAGIVVFNTPGANANSVKELVLAALLLSSRHLYDGVGYVRSLADVDDDAELNRLVEAEKKRFKGRELFGKTLGVVGLGAIGSLVARAALDLGMSVLGYDPAISVDAAWRLPSEVQRMEGLPQLFSRADFVTLHVPLIPETTGMINAESLATFKDGSVLLNFARQGVVDQTALADALAGNLGGYLADFPVPGLIDHPRVLLLPHLGASTNEAEENCAVMAAAQLMAFLESGNISNSVNFPTVQMEVTSGHRIAVVNRNVPGMLGQITSVLAERDLNVIDLLNKSRDSVAYNLIDVDSVAEDALLDALRAIPDVIGARAIEQSDVA